MTIQKTVSYIILYVLIFLSNNSFSQINPYEDLLDGSPDAYGTWEVISQPSGLSMQPFLVMYNTEMLNERSCVRLPAERRDHEPLPEVAQLYLGEPLPVLRPMCPAENSDGESTHCVRPTSWRSAAADSREAALGCQPPRRARAHGRDLPLRAP